MVATTKNHLLLHCEYPKSPQFDSHTSLISTTKNDDDILPSSPAPATISISTATQTDHPRLPKSQGLKALAEFKVSIALQRLERIPSSPRAPIEISSSDDDSSNSPLPQRISFALARPTSTAPPALAPPSTEPLYKRIRKPTKKQASQDRREEEKQRKRDARKKKKKAKTMDMTQLVDTQIMELPFRSSQ
jgi:hypothetical protein